MQAGGSGGAGCHTQRKMSWAFPSFTFGTALDFTFPLLDTIDTTSPAATRKAETTR